MDVVTCTDCGVPISAHAARYRGSTRCRTCAARRRLQTDAGRDQMRAAANAKHAQDAENKRLATRAREHGLDTSGEF